MASGAAAQSVYGQSGGIPCGREYLSDFFYFSMRASNGTVLACRITLENVRSAVNHFGCGVLASRARGVIVLACHRASGTARSLSASVRVRFLRYTSRIAVVFGMLSGCFSKTHSCAAARRIDVAFRSGTRPRMTHSGVGFRAQQGPSARVRSLQCHPSLQRQRMRAKRGGGGSRMRQKIPKHNRESPAPVSLTYSLCRRDSVVTYFEIRSAFTVRVECADRLAVLVRSLHHVTCHRIRAALAAL
jgi:hypothetical protein